MGKCLRLPRFFRTFATLASELAFFLTKKIIASPLRCDDAVEIFLVISAVGTAGVPMGCYFLTLSLMTGIHAPVGIMGIILPIYTIIDMVETAENVWSDSCVCAMTIRDCGGGEK